MLSLSTGHEEWWSVPGWEGAYEVSDLGRVRSLQRVATRCNGTSCAVRGRLLTLTIDERSGYAYVQLKRDGRRRNRTVHGLVVAAFSGLRPAGLECRHRNGNARDNRLANLVWGTRSENITDTVEHGTHAEARQVECKRHHLLREPNLLPVAVAAGHRGCFVCNRAVTAVSRTLGPRRTTSDPTEWERRVQVDADRRYASLTGAATC